MAFLVGDQLFEEVLRDIVANTVTVVARLFVEGACVMLSGEVTFKGFLGILPDPQGIQLLQVRMTLEEDDAVDQLVRVVHFLNAFCAGFGCQFAQSPILLQAVVYPVLVNRSQFAAQSCVQVLDDLCVAFHGNYPPCPVVVRLI